MRLIAFHIIPIEFYSYSNRKFIEKELGNSKKVSSQKFIKVYKEIWGNEPSIYQLEPNLDILFDHSSGCFIFRRKYEKWEFTSKNISDELLYRTQIHKSIIENNQDSPIKNFIDTLDSSKSESWPATKINYVFNYYLIYSENKVGKNVLSWAKILAEPSLIEADSMLFSTDKKIDLDNDLPIKKEFFDKIKDCDISSHAKTIVTWASIVSLSEKNKKQYEDNIALITALETKLQMAWNHGFAVGKLTENSYMEKITIKKLKPLFWRLTNSLNSIRGILSSTMSTRVQMIFNEIVTTSKIKEQLIHLDEKLKYIEKCIEQKNAHTNRFFQKMVEFLLLMMASVSIVQLSFKLPILPNSLYGILLTGSLVLLGAIAIFRRS